VQAADLREATFTGVAGFDGATFTGVAGFDGATFTGVAGFDDATFTRIARFDAARVLNLDTVVEESWPDRWTVRGNTDDPTSGRLVLLTDLGTHVSRKGGEPEPTELSG